MEQGIDEIFFNDKVVYECNCGNRKPITAIYFCRHCIAVRCKDCLSHEVDSQYCHHCLEYIPTIDAKLKKNKCASCYVCPFCSHILLTKVVQAKPEATDTVDLTKIKKSYFFYCVSCRWYSDELNLDDQSSTLFSWPEVNTPEAKRINSLLSYYRAVAQKEKLTKEKKRINPRSPNAIHLLDKYGISAALSPKVTETLRAKLYAGKLGTPGFNLQDKHENIDAKHEPSIAKPITDADCDDIDAKIDLDYEPNEETTSIEQRLMQIELQPKYLSSLTPVSKMLAVKRSLRCKQCDHNLSKPEYNPSAIKFKINLSAFYHIPEVKLHKIPKLELNKQKLVELTIKNPSQHMMRIRLTKEPTESLLDGFSTAIICLPQEELTLMPNDDTIDDSNFIQSKLKDDSKVVSFRKGNKIGIYVSVTPRSDGECKFQFNLIHDFVNTIPSQINEKKEPQISYIEHKIFVILPGKVET